VTTKIINQVEAKRLLMAITPANVLLLGPPGYGKTTLGLAYLSQFVSAQEPTLVVNGTRADSEMADLTWHKGPILIDEVHRMNKHEALYPMLDGKIEAGFMRKSEIKTFAFTTTDEGTLPGPLLSRLVHVVLTPYTREHLALIAQTAAPEFTVNILDEIARYCWGSPRKAKLLANLLARSKIRHPGQVGHVLCTVGYPLGLSYRQVSLLGALAYDSRSLSTLAGILGTGVQTVRFWESELIQARLMRITSKGRSLTKTGASVLENLESLRGGNK